MTGALHDLRTALRSVRRRPGASVAVVLTFALGIGAAGAVFLVIHAVLLSELPYPEPERLALVEGVRRTDTVERWPISYPDFRDWREQVGSSVGTLVARTGVRSFNLDAGDEVVRIPGEMVTAEYLQVLGLEPARGRWFTEAEDRPPGDRVAVIGHELWRQRFDGEPRVVGRTATLNGLPFTVVGVAPRGFRGLTDQAEVWLPLATAGTIESPPYLEERSFRWLSGVIRLAPGVGIDRAQAALDAAAARLEETYAETNYGVGARLVPLADAWFGDVRPVLWTLLMGALFVLGIACVNVANLELAWGVTRRREMAVRAAVGAVPRQLVRQVLAESTLRSGAGGLVALVAVAWATPALLALSAYELRDYMELRVGAAVIGVTLAAAVGSGLAAGVAPAVFSARADFAGLLKEGGERSGVASGRRLRSSLVVLQIALAFALFVGAALTVESFRNLRSRDLGYRTEGMLTGRIDLKGERYSEDPPAIQLARGLLEELGAVPGVRRVALVGPGMPTDDWHGMGLTVEGAPPPEGTDGHYVLRHHVTPGYFETLGIPLLAGRAFSVDDDTEAELAVVVSRSMARRHLGGEQQALGRRIKFGSPDMDVPWHRVVGVVADADHRGLRGEPGPGPDVYLAYYQDVPRSPAVTNLLLRTDLPPEELAPALRRIVGGAAPELALYDVRSLEERLDRQSATDRFLSVLLSLFAGLALVLAAVGGYGMQSFTVGSAGGRSASTSPWGRDGARSWGGSSGVP
ncbi:MAG: ABC transporter permease [Thermoanaerobaculia bacterium]